MPSPLYDYGKLYLSSRAYLEVYPRTLEEVRALIERAHKENSPVRVRASGHTFSGATLPREGELLIRMEHLDHYRFEKPGTITVGSGALVWDVRDFVGEHGLELPIYNGGWAGPSVGGFICAGGMGLRRKLPPRLRAPDAQASREGAAESAGRGEADRAGPEELDATVDVDPGCLSEVHGGFWENVVSVTLVDGTGQLRTFARSDDEFKWIFGSFGQLGVVVEAKLNLLAPEVKTAPPYPMGRSGTIPKVQQDDPKFTDGPPAPSGMPLLYWFSYLVSLEQEPDAWEELGKLVEEHSPFVRPEGGWVGPTVGGERIGYRYLIRFKNFNPPLLYARNEDFILMGFMTVLHVGTPAFDRKIFAFEKEFVELAIRKGFHLYPQAENIGRNQNYRSYYGSAVFDRFEALKQSMDPSGLLNVGECFPSEAPKPLPASSAKVMGAALGKLIG